MATPDLSLATKKMPDTAELSKKLEAIDAKHADTQAKLKAAVLSKNLDNAKLMASVMATPDLSLVTKKMPDTAELSKKLEAIDARHTESQAK